MSEELDNQIPDLEIPDIDLEDYEIPEEEDNAVEDESGGSQTFAWMVLVKVVEELQKHFMTEDIKNVLQ